MSNNSSASFGATPGASSACADKNTPKASFWRRLFDAWVASYANRLDPEGHMYQF